MPYKTKPYLMFGIGTSVRGITYTIDNADMPDRRFRETGWVTERASLPLADASAVRIEEKALVKSMFRKSLGVGDVQLSGANFNHLCKNIVDVNAFIAAIEGKHPDVQPPKEAHREDQSQSSLFYGMGKGHFLNETYSVCGKTFEIYTKTGRYRGRKQGEGYEFFREDCEGEESFTITPKINLTSDFGLELEDRVSMAMFGEYYGPLFLLFNHRNSKYSYYPEAIDDLFWSLNDCGGIRQIFIGRKLKREAKTFTSTQTFSKVLEKLKNVR